jgi:hypothetical protein
LIKTIAGNGEAGFNIEDGLATNVSIHYPMGIVFDYLSGNLFFSDYENNRIRVLFSNNPFSSPTSNPTSLPTIIADNRAFYSGLAWTAYNSYFNDNTDFFTTASTLNGLNDVSTGYSSDFSSLATATNNNFIVYSEQEYFSIEFFGYFYTQSYSGTWTFETSSDDASYLWIGDVAIEAYTATNALVDNGGLHEMQTVSNTIELNANTYYPLRIQFAQGDGYYDLIVTITRPDGFSFTNGDGYFFSLSEPTTLTLNPTTQTTSVIP